MVVLYSDINRLAIDRLSGRRFTNREFKWLNEPVSLISSCHTLHSQLRAAKGQGREGPLLVLCAPTLLPNCCMQSVSAQRDMEDLLPLSFPFELQQYQNGRLSRNFPLLVLSGVVAGSVVPLHV